MNRDLIINMPAGPEMDVLVAEKVMNWHLDYITYWDKCWYTKDNLKAGFKEHEWKPSLRIAHAWYVVEHKTGGRIQFRLEIASVNRVIYAKFVDTEPPEKVIGGACGEEASEAICKAALLMVMEDENETGEK